MNYWLVKQEPEDYAFSQLVKDKCTDWTGVRNFQARNNLRAMQTRRQRPLLSQRHREGRRRHGEGFAREAFPDLQGHGFR